MYVHGSGVKTRLFRGDLVIFKRRVPTNSNALIVQNKEGGPTPETLDLDPSRFATVYFFTFSQAKGKPQGRKYQGDI